MEDNIGRAIDIMLDTADWLELTMPDGEVTMFGITGDYQMLVAELRRAAESIIEATRSALTTH